MIDNWLSLLRRNRAFAVIRASEFEMGRQMARAVAASGMELIEITWNSVDAPNLINKLRCELPSCTIGTGTILNSQDLHDAIACGVEYIFTPHIDPELIRIATAKNIPIIPGALTPTEIVTAWNLGAPSIKVFPVQSLGGTSYIKSLQGPLKHIPLIPTGGVTIENAEQFLSAGAIAVGLSGELFPQALIRARNWEAITQNAKKLLQNINTSLL
ncbi:MAG: bifunctional 4-hydroxy-2-oxoglutarate aldolase/2-dehydro-3-deoxy-phosphogluconate aldolase [Calothrix sp. C42_A2020_038]|nr:bifunctional 4-hydroxy-2-oxoglutarate aldolase/2-dehydro-3-deoxy-phosphogluconate aldolase [Calothrix sp. C42_A2020_038]